MDGADAAFNEALRLSDGHASEPAVFAQAGLAAIAASRGDARTALDASRRAMDQTGHLEGYYDIRIEPYVWGIRARSLLLAGDAEGARTLANTARDAASRYYAPGAAEITEAEELLRNTTTHVSLH